MKRIIRVIFILIISVILGYVQLAWATSVATEQVQRLRSPHARITKANKNLVSVVGVQARVIAVKGNRVKIQHLKDASRTVTVTVNNASMFQEGQYVTINGEILTPH